MPTSVTLSDAQTDAGNASFKLIKALQAHLVSLEELQWGAYMALVYANTSESWSYSTLHKIQLLRVTYSTMYIPSPLCALLPEREEKWGLVDKVDVNYLLYVKLLVLSTMLVLKQPALNGN